MTRPLTQREADVLRYKAQGRSDHEIAMALNVNHPEVRNAVARAIRALGARTLDHAIQIHNQPQEHTR